MASETIFPLKVWQAGALNNSIPANDNALRVEVLAGRAIGVLDAPPSSPAARAQYVVGSTPGGAWASFTADDVVIYIEGTWLGWSPFEGWLKTIGDSPMRFDGAAWVELGGGGGVSDRNSVSALSISAGAVAVDYALGDYFTLALSSDVTGITFSNMPGLSKGASLMIRITQGATVRTVAWPSSFKWEGAAGAVSTAANAVDLLAITTMDNGVTWDATLSKGRA